MYKSTGGANLTWSGLEETTLDAETSLKNLPLTYLEDDVQLLVLTRNAMTFAQPNLVSEEDADAVENIDFRKRAKYLRRCKDVLWS